MASLCYCSVKHTDMHYLDIFLYDTGFSWDGGGELCGGNTVALVNQVRTMKRSKRIIRRRSKMIYISSGKYLPIQCVDISQISDVACICVDRLTGNVSKWIYKYHIYIYSIAVDIAFVNCLPPYTVCARFKMACSWYRSPIWHNLFTGCRIIRVD